jgi:nucleotide-binding universal stress UspA family protein
MVVGTHPVDHAVAMDTQIAAGSIVVAVDGSEHAARAVEWAARESDLAKRRLVILSVAEQRPMWTASALGAGAVPPGAHDESERHARSAVEQAAAQARGIAPEVDVATTVVLGEPRQVLVEVSGDAHMIVMGSRGRGPLRTMLLGSVTSAVVKQARCPVVVCRPGDDTVPMAGVVVGVDGTEESLPVIELAFEQASLRSLPLTVLHVYWDAVTAVSGLRRSHGSVLPEADVEDLRALLSESVAGFRERYPDVPVSLRLEHGLVDDVLVQDSSWDLVVVGRHPVDTVGRVLIGSIANAVLERADTTVAMVPEAPTS